MNTSETVVTPEKDIQTTKKTEKKDEKTTCFEQLIMSDFFS